MEREDGGKVLAQKGLGALEEAWGCNMRVRMWEDGSKTVRNKDGPEVARHSCSCEQQQKEEEEEEGEREGRGTEEEAEEGRNSQEV